MLEQREEGGITNLATSAHDMQMTAGLFMEWAVGKTGELFNTDAGKLMLPGSKIHWEIHMYAIGQEIKDSQVELGIYFYPKGTVPPHRTVLRMFDVSRGRRSRHSAELDLDDAELLRDAGAGAHRELPAAHAHARQGDVDRGHLSRTASASC